MSFIVIYALVLFKEDHDLSKKARVYFNFLNTLTGKGFFLIFIGLMILEKHSWYDWIIGFVSIGTGICNIVVGWDQEPAPVPQSEFNFSAERSSVPQTQNTS